MEYVRRPFVAAWRALGLWPRAVGAGRAPATAFDVYTEHFLDILLWEDKKRTATYFVVVVQFLWLVLLLNLKPFGTLSLALLLCFVVDRFHREKLIAEYTGRHRDLIESFGQLLPKLWDSLCGLRRDSRALFAMVMSLCFLWLNFVSRIMTGTWLAVLVTLTTFVAPIGLRYFCKKLPQSEQLTERRVLAEDELIPFIIDKDLDNKDPELESLLTDKTADSASTSLTAGLGAMPSYLEVAGHPSEDLQEEDLLPKGGAGPPSVPSSDSEDGSASARGVHFDSDHFAGSSSSEEEVRLAPRDDSDGSDFEIVDGDDLRDK